MQWTFLGPAKYIVNPGKNRKTKVLDRPEGG